MEINVNIDAIDLDTVIDQVVELDSDGEERIASERTLGDVVVDRVTQQVVTSVSRGGYPSLQERIRNIRDEIIREQLAAIISEALTRPIQPTNEWGEKSGETTTLSQYIAAAAQKAVSGDSKRYGSDIPGAAQKVIAAEVNRAFENELIGVVKAEKEKVVAAVRAKAADLIADSVKAGVRS